MLKFHTLCLSDDFIQNGHLWNCKKSQGTLSVTYLALVSQRVRGKIHKTPSGDVVMILRLTVKNISWITHCEIALHWMPQNLTYYQSTLIQVMAWCRQATSHYLRQCWPRSMSLYCSNSSLLSFMCMQYLARQIVTKANCHPWTLWFQRIWFIILYSLS